MQKDELSGIVLYIVTETFLTDRIILSKSIFLLFFKGGIIDYIEVVRIDLIIFRFFQINELVYVCYVF